MARNDNVKKVAYGYVYHRVNNNAPTSRSETPSPTTTTATSCSETSSSFSSLEALLLLFAKHKALKRLSLALLDPPVSRSPDDLGLMSDVPYRELSTPCLEQVVSFTSNAASRCPLVEFAFHEFPFSINQWRAILFNCPKHTQLHVGCSHQNLGQRAVRALVESWTNNPSPHRALAPPFALRLSIDESMPLPPVLDPFFSSWGSPSCSLGVLSLDTYNDADFRGTQQQHAVPYPRLMQSIRTNRRLEKLTLDIHRVSLEDWNLLCDVVGSHPTIRSVTFRCDHSGLILPSQLKTNEEFVSFCDEILWQATCANRVLREFKWNVASSLTGAEHPQVKAFLSLNDFRHQVQDSIVEEADQAARRRKWGHLLVQPAVRNYLDRLYEMLQCQVEWLKPIQEDPKHNIQLRSQAVMYNWLCTLQEPRVTSIKQGRKSTA